jgi:hypothetical protein
MDLELARLYNTPGRAHAEAVQAANLEKEAAIEIFSKLAAENGIDLTTLSDGEIERLWTTTFNVEKVAELPPQFAAHMAGKKKDEHGEHDEKHEGKHDEKKEHEEHDKKEHEKKAAAELASVQEETQKLAFADKMGRRMAHALVNELDSINDARTKEASVKGAGGATKTATAGATGLPSVKVAGALDTLAVSHALKLATEAKLDPEEVQRKLAARAELGGFAESVKIASVPVGNLQAAVEVRALELLEQAGYSVTWK